jgi:hypothetical protein
MQILSNIVNLNTYIFHQNIQGLNFEDFQDYILIKMYSVPLICVTVASRRTRVTSVCYQSRFYVEKIIEFHIKRKVFQNLQHIEPLLKIIKLIKH